MIRPVRYIFVGSLMAVALTSAPQLPLSHAAERKTLEGTVADAMCGLEHKMAGATAAECTAMCVGKGSKYSLISGGTVFELSGNADEIEPLAGQQVKLTGTVDGKKIQVEKITRN